ncbi:MAG: phosphoethanolamine transferase [Ramlibacter sp.]
MKPYRPTVPVLAASLWMAAAGNAPLWRELQALGLLETASGWWLAAALAGLLAAALYAILSLLAWRPLLKPAITVLLVAAAAGAHFMWSYHVVIDSAMTSNALQTDWHEVNDLVTPRLLAALGVGAIAPAWLLWRQPVAYARWNAQALRNAGAAVLALLLAAALVLAGFQPLASAMRNHKQLRYLMNPLNTVYALAQGAAGARPSRLPPAPIGLDARLAPAAGRPPLLLLVLGETARGDHLGLNGYARDTTPELAREGATSFRDAWACGTSTAASVPCMFSHLGREAFLARRGESENLLDVLRHAGLAVLWLDNQPGGCKGVCDRVPTVATSAAGDPALCADGECLDGILLQGLDERLAALPAPERARGVVLVMHQMGSHGPAYSRRSPAAAKRYVPECTSRHLPDCSTEAIRNAYDNSIAYTDHVLGSAIRWLRRQDDFATALLYVSDHGESLGENNLYLHGLPYALAPDAQKHVAWVAWLSGPMEQRAGGTGACLAARAGRRVTHDHLFHSVLGLLHVDTAVYARALDLFSGCQAPAGETARAA